MTALAHDPADIAEQLGATEWWVREQIRKGRVGHLKVGRRQRLLPEHVDQLIALARVEPAPTDEDAGPVAPEVAALLSPRARTATH